MSADWRDPPSEPCIIPNRVHVWFCDFSDVCDAGNAADCLSTDEQSRAERFHQEEDRLVFQASHIVLGYVVGLYMGLRAAEVLLRTAAYGKPELAAKAPTLSFNLTHSYRSAACAISDGAAVGIDMEAIDPRRFDHPTAEQVLSNAEMAQLRSLAPNEQLAAFFRAWTRKEAY